MPSKYELNPVDIMKMSTPELKDYIRGASKVIGKRIRGLESLPYGAASETLSYINNSGTALKTGKSTFATRGLSRDELLAKANAVNVIASLDETPAAFSKQVDEELKAIFDEETPDKLLEIFKDEMRFEMLKDYIDVHMDSIYSLLTSERVNELANDYEEQPEEFYTKLLDEALDQYARTEKTHREKYFKEKRKPKKRGKKK